MILSDALILLVLQFQTASVDVTN